MIEVLGTEDAIEPPERSRERGDLPIHMGLGGAVQLGHLREEKMELMKNMPSLKEFTRKL